MKVEFGEYMNYVRNLTFEENPKYSKMKMLFETILKKNNLEYDFFWDWRILDQNTLEEV